jgi:glycosyltransferase involved in cell wall biosynthesis
MKHRTLLIGPKGHGGEEVFVQTLLENPPAGFEYVVAGSFHEGASGAPCRTFEEVLLNRLLHPRLIPDIGFRSLRLRERFDLVHVHAHPVRLGRLGRIPLVMSEGSSSAVYLQDYLNWDDQRLAHAYAKTRRMYRALAIHDRLLNLDRVSKAFVFSHWAREVNIRWGADPNKMAVVYPGFATPPPVTRSSRKTFTFLFVGTDFERKGGFEVVDAFASLATRYPAVRLVIVSSDPRVPNPDREVHSWLEPTRRRDVLSWLDDLERQGLIERFPLLPRQQLYREFYPRADAFVMPSRAEGFGFTNVEAHSFGLPVISSRVGPIPEIVRDGHNGLLVEGGDVVALENAMSALASDPERSRRLGENGRADFLECFTLEHFRAAVGQIYAEASEQPCAGS